MAISVDPVTHIISIPKVDLSLISGTLYELDTDAFRLELKDWEDSLEGIIQPKTHNHNTEVVIAGITYARSIAILPPYSVEFEDGQYSVILSGSNNNIWDVGNGLLVQNQVQVIPTNSAGLIVKSVGSGLSGDEQAQLLEIRLLARELHQLRGYTSGVPATFTPSSITAGAITLALTGDGETTTTVTRT